MCNGSVLAPVCVDLAAESARQAVDGAADVPELLLGRQAVDVPAVPQHPSGQRHQHKQSPCTRAGISLTPLKHVLHMTHILKQEHTYKYYHVTSAG